MDKTKDRNWENLPNYLKIPGVKDYLKIMHKLQYLDNFAGMETYLLRIRFEIDGMPVGGFCKYNIIAKDGGAGGCEYFREPNEDEMKNISEQMKKMGAYSLK